MKEDNQEVKAMSYIKDLPEDLSEFVEWATKYIYLDVQGSKCSKLGAYRVPARMKGAITNDIKVLQRASSNIHSVFLKDWNGLKRIFEAKYGKYKVQNCQDLSPYLRKLLKIEL